MVEESKDSRARVFDALTQMAAEETKEGLAAQELLAQLAETLPPGLLKRQRSMSESGADPRPSVKNVGKALSLEVATRMIEHADINTVMSKQGRIKAVGTIDDFPQDAMTMYMTKYAEEIFEPKRILDSGDWLKSYREPDQRFEFYKKGNGNI